jgi:hypothetical protein
MPNFTVRSADLQGMLAERLKPQRAGPGLGIGHEHDLPVSEQAADRFACGHDGLRTAERLQSAVDFLDVLFHNLRQPRDQLAGNLRRCVPAGRAWVGGNRPVTICGERAARGDLGVGECFCPLRSQ